MELPMQGPGDGRYTVTQNSVKCTPYINGFDTKNVDPTEENSGNCACYPGLDPGAGRKSRQSVGLRLHLKSSKILQF